MRSRKVATARHCRRGPCVYRAIRDGWPCPVIREKSQSRAQNDSLSLSPAHDSTIFIYTSEPWAALCFGRPIFGPKHSRGGLRPKGWTGLGGSFDRLPSVVVLELRGAEVAER